MRRLKLIRLEGTDYATYGQFATDENKQVCMTLEPPWRDNEPEKSCIPAGIYVAHRRVSPKRGYEVFELVDVPGRENIQIHIGNLPTQTEGCVLVGRHFGKLAGRSAVLDSGEAYRDFMLAHRGVDVLELHVLAPAIAEPLPHT